MKIIKFRATDITGDRLFIGDYFGEGLFDDNHHYIKNNAGTDAIDPKTLGQFLNVYDANWNEIYSNSMLVINGEHYLIEFSPQSVSYILRDSKNRILEFQSLACMGTEKGISFTNAFLI